ncbi:hypothetical protein NDU88_006810 [Pleurodeles waltl]|uniref:Uncharacterized protein n=1 Tax=Pleurodeles waltl TaxID=8319 RepID=A0AAV7MDB3_PLEWA|nr:hypothetical protein NDU88_006810 [Pleurodeles waltl]
MARVDTRWRHSLSIKDFTGSGGLGRLVPHRRTSLEREAVRPARAWGEMPGAARGVREQSETPVGTRRQGWTEVGPACQLGERKRWAEIPWERQRGGPGP